MKLKPLPQRQASAELRGRMPGELHTALVAYTVYYRETLGQATDVWPLVVRMVRQFLETDREFQAWRRRPQNGLGAGPVHELTRKRAERAAEEKGITGKERGDGTAR